MDMAPAMLTGCATAAACGWACAHAVGLHLGDDVARAAAVDRDRRAAEERERPARRAVRILLIRHAQSQTNVDRDGLHNGRHLEVPLSQRGVAQATALGHRLARGGQVYEAIYCSEALRTQQTAELACAALRDPPPVQVVPTHNLGLAASARGICEIAMGSWTGRDKKACETAEVKAAREADCWEWRPPGRCEEEGIPGESYRDVEQRFVRFLEGAQLTSRRDRAGPCCATTRMQLPALTSLCRSLCLTVRLVRGRCAEVILQKAADGNRNGSSQSDAASGAAAAGVPVVLVFSHHAAIRCALRPLLECAPRMVSPKLSPKNTSITELSYSPAAGRKGGWTLHRLNDAAHLEAMV
jgi:broad specificity phosphatase PhoE